jgi:hypothetical protein
MKFTVGSLILLVGICLGEDQSINLQQETQKGLFINLRICFYWYRQRSSLIVPNTAQWVPDGVAEELREISTPEARWTTALSGWASLLGRETLGLSMATHSQLAIRAEVAGR